MTSPSQPQSEQEREGEPDAQSERAESERNVNQAGNRLLRGLISLGILVVLVVCLLLAVPGLHDAAKRVGTMDEGWVIASVLAEILSCACYVLAFLQVFERAPIRLGARVALSELAFGSAVSLGGAGSAAVGTWLLVERGATPARVAERSAVLFLLTSAINVLTLAVVGWLTWVGILPGSHNPLLTLLPGAVATAAIVLVAALPGYADRLARRVQSDRLTTLLEQTAQTVRDTRGYLRRPDWRIIGPIGYLWFDIGCLLCCFAATGRVPQLSTVVLAYQIGYLSNFIPIPGSLGILDGSFVGMFVLFGVNASLATAATVVYHGITLWIPAAWGTVAFLVLRRSRGEPLRLRPPRAERRALREQARAG